MWGPSFPILNRFAPFPGVPGSADDPFVIVQTCPSGYAQNVNGTSVPSPLMFNQDPANQLLVRGSYIAAKQIGGGLHKQYVPTNTPSGIVGGGLFGPGGIGYRTAYHGTLYPVTVGQYTVYEPAANGDQRK